MINLFPDLLFYLRFKRPIFLLVIFLFTISCNQTIEKTNKHSPDLSLLKKNNDLRNSGSYKAIFQLNTAHYNIAKKANDKEEMAHALINFAMADTGTGNYKNSLFFLNRAEMLLIDSDNVILKAMLYHQLSILNMILELTDNADIYSKKALHFAKQCNVKDLKTFYLDQIYSTRGDILESQKKRDSALFYYKEARRLNPIALNNIAIADHYVSYEKKLDSARIYINDALKLIKNEKTFNAQQIAVYITAGDFHMETKEYDQAENFYKDALKAMDTSNNMYYPYLHYIYQKMISLYKATGNGKDEYVYLDKYNETKKNFDKKKDGTINLLANKFITDLKNEDIENQKRTYIYWCLGGILLIFSGLYAFWKIKKLKDNKEALKAQTETLKDKLEDKNTEELIELARKNDSFFIIKFREVYPQFIAKLLAINPDLENSELVFCAMLRLNFSSKEIAQNMTIQHTSVQKRKSRVRKRLNIPSDVDIYDFFNQLK